jgi:predicted amidophosphoribosyltransferase
MREPDMDWAGELREWLLDALALVLPATCAGCGADGRELCAACRERLTPQLVHLEAPGGVPVHAGAPYGELVQRVVLAVKEGRTGLAVPLATLLSAALADAAPDAGVELCAVPSTRAASRRRGFDPARLVLSRTGRRDARVLRAARPHRVQKGLGREDRRVNLRDVHRARYRLDGRCFLLVDDVVTTGATIAEAARAIREAGGEVAGAVAVAATPLRGAARHTHTRRSGTVG